MHPTVTKQHTPFPDMNTKSTCLMFNQHCGHIIPKHYKLHYFLAFTFQIIDTEKVSCTIMFLFQFNVAWNQFFRVLASIHVSFQFKYRWLIPRASAYGHKKRDIGGFHDIMHTFIEQHIIASEWCHKVLRMDSLPSLLDFSSSTPK